MSKYEMHLGLAVFVEPLQWHAIIPSHNTFPPPDLYLEKKDQLLKDKCIHKDNMTN